VEKEELKSENAWAHEVDILHHTSPFGTTLFIKFNETCMVTWVMRVRRLIWVAYVDGWSRKETVALSWENVNTGHLSFLCESSYILCCYWSRSTFIKYQTECDVWGRGLRLLITYWDLSSAKVQTVWNKWVRPCSHENRAPAMPRETRNRASFAANDLNKLRPDLQNILRQCYDYLTIMPKLRWTFDGRQIYKTS